MRRNHARDEGVDHVVGFILVTGIAIASVALVLVGGQPYLDRLQADQEADSMVRQFLELDHEVTSLIAGSPAGKTPVWGYSMARGSLYLNGTGHMWAFAVDDNPILTETRLQFLSFHDNDDSIIVHNAGTTPATQDIADLSARVWEYTGGTATERADSGLNAIHPLTVTNSVTIDLGLSDGTLWGKTVEVRFYDDASIAPTVPISRLWLIDSGALVWENPAGGQVTRQFYENGGVFANQDSNWVWHEQPGIKGPRTQGADNEVVFLRVYNLTGSLSVAGQRSGTSLISHVGTHARLGISDVERISIYPPIGTADSWMALLDDDLLGYTYTTQRANGGPWLAYRDTSHQTGALSAHLVTTGLKLTGDTV